MSESPLPSGFEALSRFVDLWAGLDERGRIQRRIASSFEELQTFYDAAVPKLADAMAYLKEKPLGSLDAKERNLFDVILGLIEISFSIEVYGAVVPEGVFDVSRVEVDVAAI